MVGDNQNSTSVIPASVRIVPEIPIFFADGIASHSFASGISKFYFYRTDSDALAPVDNVNVPVAQAVMSAEGFAKALHFLNHRLKLMIRAGAISQEAVDAVFAYKHAEV
jgi:hypothetical protein